MGAFAHATASAEMQAVIHMTQQQVLDDEDQMAQALAELRNERSDTPDAVVEVKAEAPAAEPVAEEQPVVEEAPEPAPSTEAAAAPSPEDQLKAAQAELHKMRSEIGRVGALNRKYMEAAQEAAALREQLAQRQAAPQEPTGTEDAASKLAAVAEQVKDFPELAGIVAAVSDALKHADKKTEEVARRVAAQVVEPLEPLRLEQTTRAEQEQKAAYDAALEQFNSTYPTAVDVIKSDDFKVWLSNQPGAVQYAFHKGTSPMEAMTVMDTYDMHLRRTGREPVAHISSPQPEVAPAPVKSAQNMNRLQRAAGIPSRPSGSQGSAPPADDFEASLAYFRNKRLSAQRAAA